VSGASNESLSQLFQQCRPELQGFLSHRLGRQDADDIVQETYLRLLQYPALDTIQNLRAFLFKTASNLVIDRVREQRTRFERVQEGADVDLLSSFAPTPEAAAEGAIELGRFRAVLAELPPVYRHAFLLNRVDGLTHTEIAKRLGISKKSVERYIEKAFDHCCSRLGRVHASSKRA
jgi:RNA polymerase sigma-70 factor (ECF subfamily)